jgi:hypothetical protein
MCSNAVRRFRRRRRQTARIVNEAPPRGGLRWFKRQSGVDQPPLVPASTAVPTAAAKQQNEKYNDEKRGGIHVSLPRNTAYCAAWNSDFFDNV